MTCFQNKFKKLEFPDGHYLELFFPTLPILSTGGGWEGLLSPAMARFEMTRKGAKPIPALFPSFLPGRHYRFHLHGC